MRQVVAVVVLILTMAGALATGLGAAAPCPVMAGHPDHALHQMTADGNHGLQDQPSPLHGHAGDFCKHACLSSLLPQPATAMPVVLAVIAAPEPAETALPASLRPDLADRPPKPLA